MDRHSVSVPGKVLDETVAFGLTFTEIVILLSIPLVLVLPAVTITAVPLWVTFVLLVIGVVSVGVVIVAAPENQSPISWFPNHVKRRVGPDSYTLQPRDDNGDGAPDVVYKDVVYTAPILESEAEKQEFTAADYATFIQHIEYAERLELPDHVDKETVASILYERSNRDVTEITTEPGDETLVMDGEVT